MPAVGVWVKRLTRIQSWVCPEFPYRLLATVAFEQVLAFPFWLLVVLPFYEEPTVVNVAKHARDFFNFVYFLGGIVIVGCSCRIYIYMGVVFGDCGGLRVVICHQLLIGLMSRQVFYLGIESRILKYSNSASLYAYEIWESRQEASYHLWVWRICSRDGDLSFVFE